MPTYSTLLCCLAPMYLILPLQAVVIDNTVMGDPKVDCSGEQVGISFTTQKSFAGRIFVSGYAAQKECVMSGTDHIPALSLGFSQCGVQRSRQLNPPGMIVYTTVVISFHPVFITKMDRAYRVACHYMEASRTVTADMEVSMLSTAAMTSAPSMPECRYELLLGGPTGTPAKYAKVGDQVYHKWTCDSKDNSYCMRVHSCTVDDGQGNESYMVVNRQGCATDKFVLQNLEYLTDLMAGQETHVVKFADKASLYFSCQIELLSKASESANCATARPNCTEPLGGGIVLTIPAAQPGSNAPSSPPTQGNSSTSPVPSPAHITRTDNNDHTDLRRRAARHKRSDNANHSIDLAVRRNFQVVGDMDLLRQHLTVLDLDDSPSPNDDSSRNDIRRHPSQKSFGTLNPFDHSRYGASKVPSTSGLTSPICISPLGFGMALFGLLTVFLIALSVAVRYAVPSRIVKCDDQSNKIVQGDFSAQNGPRYLAYIGH